jgi:hypothetical protein
MYNAELEAAIDSAVKRWKDVGKKKMFGGVCWLLNPCELESPGSRRGRNAEFAGGRVIKGSHRLLPVGAPQATGASASGTTV